MRLLPFLPRSLFPMASWAIVGALLIVVWYTDMSIVSPYRVSAHGKHTGSPDHRRAECRERTPNPMPSVRHAIRLYSTPQRISHAMPPDPTLRCRSEHQQKNPDLHPHTRREEGVPQLRWKADNMDIVWHLPLCLVVLIPLRSRRSSWGWMRVNASMFNSLQVPTPSWNWFTRTCASDHNIYPYPHSDKPTLIQTPISLSIFPNSHAPSRFVLVCCLTNPIPLSVEMEETPIRTTTPLGHHQQVSSGFLYVLALTLVSTGSEKWDHWGMVCRHHVYSQNRFHWECDFLCIRVQVSP